MPRAFPAPTLLRPARLMALGAALVLLGGCASMLRRTPPPRYGYHRLYYETVRILNVEEPDPRFYRERARLEVMEGELDAVLTALITDASVDEPVRANAAILLADRRGFNAVGVLRRVLVESPSDAVRAAAVVGLQRFTADSPQVRNALRAALSDPSARVRLGALQGLEVEDAWLVRRFLAAEDNPQVRVIAEQLMTLFEARGAPLARNERGELRTIGGDTVPVLVFQPAFRDTLGGVQVGALWVELARGRGLVPLGQQVEVVDEVVPAFFDPQRRTIVFEAGRQVQVRDVRSGQTRAVGPGVAPRLVPFSDRFVYLREVPGSRRPAGSATEVDYTVMRAAFSGGTPEAIGTLRATIRSERHHGASPVRTLVVGETRDGFVLRGEGVTPFVLPGTENAPRE